MSIVGCRVTSLLRVWPSTVVMQLYAHRVTKTLVRSWVVVQAAFASHDLQRFRHFAPCVTVHTAAAMKTRILCGCRTGASGSGQRSVRELVRCPACR